MFDNMNTRLKMAYQFILACQMNGMNERDILYMMMVSGKDTNVQAELVTSMINQEFHNESH